MIEKKYIAPLLILLAFGAVFFMSWPSSYVPVSEETVKEISYGNEFRNWSFRDQIELADVLHKLAIDEDPKIGDRPEKVREYVLKLAGTVRYLRANNHTTDIKGMDLGETLLSLKTSAWDSKDRADLPLIVKETRQKKKIDFTSYSQRVVIGYITLVKNSALQNALDGDNDLGIYLKL